METIEWQEYKKETPILVKQSRAPQKPPYSTFSLAERAQEIQD